MTSVLNCHISLELQDSSRSQTARLCKKKGKETCPFGLSIFKVWVRRLWRVFFLRWQVYTNREVFFSDKSSKSLVLQGKVYTNREVFFSDKSSKSLVLQGKVYTNREVFSFWWIVAIWIACCFYWWQIKTDHDTWARKTSCRDYRRGTDYSRKYSSSHDSIFHFQAAR